MFNKIKLPTSLKEFDEIVERVVRKFKLTDPHHAAAIISVTIRHLPSHSAFTTLDHLGQSVIKNIANHIADHKSKTLQHSAQIEHLAAILKSNPLDTQARDQLQQAANDGSQEAKKALNSLEEVPTIMADA